MIRQHLVRAGKPVPIWVTEWGWSATAVGQAKQATYVGKSLDLLRTAYPYVTVATYFLGNDVSAGSLRQLVPAEAGGRVQSLCFMQSVVQAAPIRRTTNTPAPPALP